MSTKLIKTKDYILLLDLKAEINGGDLFIDLTDNSLWENEIEESMQKSILSENNLPKHREKIALIPIVEKTQICFVDCGKEICECKPCKNIKDFIGNISSKELDEDIKEIIDNNFDDLI